MEYMRQFPAQLERYLEWQWVETHRLHKHLLEESSPEMYAGIAQEKREADEAQYQRVRSLFQFEVRTATGTKTRMQEGWSREDLFHRAERVGLAASYRTVMPVANQILHGTISGWVRDLDEVSRRIDFPPTDRWSGEALIAAHMALIQSLETASLALNVTPEPGLETLKEVFHAAWHQAAPGLSEAADHGERDPAVVDGDEEGEATE